MNKCEQNNKCNFCEKISFDVKFQTLDGKKHVPMCNNCYLEILFPNNTIKNLYEKDNSNEKIQLQMYDKCNFCEQRSLDVKFQTLDRKKYVPMCNKCYLDILFPNNTIKKNKNNIIKKN